MSESKDVFVFFSPSGRRGHVSAGTSVRDAALQLGVDLDSICGGIGRCGRCQVEVSAGRFDKLSITSAAEHLSAPDEAERVFAQRRRMKPQRRLGCRALIEGDVVIDVPQAFQSHRPAVRKDASNRQVLTDADLRPCYVEVPLPADLEPLSDARRLLDQLREVWQLDMLDIDPWALKGLASNMRAGQNHVTAILRNDAEVIDILPGLVTELYGVAVDIGTTTLAVQLVRLSDGAVVGSAGGMNPQIRFGEDVMSRLSYLMMNDATAAQSMTDAVRASVAELVVQACVQAELDPQRVASMVTVGNSVMHHLFMGLDATGLATAPFTLVAGELLSWRAEPFGLGIMPSAKVHMLPCIGAHVGSDAAAAMLAEGVCSATACTLLIDIGTNAELIICDGQQILSASSPTGPAFEGGQISSGQRAATGAIERVRIDPDTGEPIIKVIGCDHWSDAPEFTGQMVSGICGSGIVEVIVEMARAGLLLSDGSINGEAMARCARIVPDGPVFAYILHDSEQTPIWITQADVRAIQLAKAALRAGAELLLDKLQRPEVRDVRLAGGFGSQIDPAYAIDLGLLPVDDTDAVRAVGNASGEGARMALLSRAARKGLSLDVNRITNVEIATEADFQRHFVEAMAITCAPPAPPRTRGGRKRQRSAE